VWFPYLRRRGLRLNAFIGRPLPRFGALRGRLGREAGIDGVGRRLPPPEDVGRPTRGRLGREGALGVGLSWTMPGRGVTFPPKLGRRLPPPEDVGRPTRGRLGLVVGPAGFNTGFGRLPPIGIAGLGRGRRGLTVVVFPRPGTTRLIFGSFI